MSGDDIASFAYLGLLGAVLIAAVFVNKRLSLGQAAQSLALWGLIFVGVVAIYGLWGDIQHTLRPAARFDAQSQSIEVPRQADGHYYLTLMVNETPIEFVVDTGASEIVLTQEDARRIGFDPQELPYFGRAATANGEVRTAQVRLDSIALGPVADRNVRAWVNEGEMDRSLLGMSYLERWGRIEIGGGALVLTR